MTGRPPGHEPRLSPHAPEGTILPAVEHGCFLVKGRTDWYTCAAERGECSCPDYRFRRPREPGPCRHLRLLADYLKTKERVLTPTGKARERGPTPMAIKPEFLINLKGTEFPRFAGVLDAATQAGLRSLCTRIVQLPAPENGHMAVVMARAEFADGRVFEDVGDASPLNTSSQIATAALRLASTRAAGRALRWAINCGATLLEELPDHGEKAARPSLPAADRPRSVAAPAPAAADRTTPISRPVAAALAGDDRRLDPPRGTGREADGAPPEAAPAANGPQTVCSWPGCGVPLTPGQITISRRHYGGRLLCPTHQTALKRKIAARPV
jgi:hypothetical protein